MRAAIVASVDAPPVLEPTEHDLDLVALSVERSIVRDGHLAVALRRNAGGGSALGESVPEPVGIIPSSPIRSRVRGKASIMRAAPL